MDGELEEGMAVALCLLGLDGGAVDGGGCGGVGLVRLLLAKADARGRGGGTLVLVVVRAVVFSESMWVAARRFSSC